MSNISLKEAWGWKPPQANHGIMVLYVNGKKHMSFFVHESAGLTGGGKGDLIPNVVKIPVGRIPSGFDFIYGEIVLPNNTPWTIDYFPNNQSNNTEYSNIAYKEYEYVPINTEYSKTQFAVLPAENTGIAGIYHIRGGIGLHDNKLFVSGMGDTPAKGQGDISFWMKAKVFINGKLCMVQDLKNDQPGLWPDDGFFIIGSTGLFLPEPGYGQNTSLVLEGGYYFSTAGSPMVMPVPMSTEYKLDIQVREKPEKE